MNIKPKLYLAKHVMLDYKNMDDLLPPSTFGGGTGSEFTFDEKTIPVIGSGRLMKPNSCHNLRNIFDGI